VRCGIDCDRRAPHCSAGSGPENKIIKRYRDSSLLGPHWHAITRPPGICAVATALQHRIPAIFPERVFAESGGLVSYGVVQSEMYRLAATYADRILRGSEPSELPVQLATKFELVINLKTAKALGLDVPLHLQQRADEVIE
jgi:putative tryptophan/tyrosine transport system substrate-binding protein